MKRLLIALFGFGLLPGCSDDDSYPEMTVTSPAFGDGETIPLRHTCDGEGISPPLSLSEVPDETASFAVIMDDPDAPGGTYTHWVLYRLPGRNRFIAEDQDRNGGDGALQGTNSSGKTGYLGPCPPRGKEHHYVFRVYALDRSPALEAGATRAKLKSAMKGHIVGYGELVGLYRRPG